MQAVEFFFDYACPYCYRGYLDLMALLPAWDGLALKWLPIEAHPKAEEPHHLPYVDLAVQGAYYIKDMGFDEKPYHDRILRAYFEEKKAIDDPSSLAALAGDIGLDAAAFEDAVRSGRYAAPQLAANDYAYEQNKVWAVPTFVCGVRRLDAVEGIGVRREQLAAFLKDCIG